MKIQFFKNRDLILEDCHVSDKFKKETGLLNYEKLIDDLTSSLFILEKDINDSQLLKIFIIGAEDKLKVYFLDNKHKIATINANKCDFNNDNIEEHFINIYNNGKIVEISPYSLNADIKKTFYQLVKVVHNKIERHASNKNLRTFNLIDALYKSEVKKVTNYVQNICFKNIDKDLFKECYPYNLHSKKIKNNCLYNLLSDNRKVRDNFLTFKNKHSFLSMVFINKSKSVLNSFFNFYSEETILKNIKKMLKSEFGFITDEQFNYLKNKSYNNFLYIKTPEKYFRLIEKAEITDIESLNLMQLKFLNKVYHRNRTYIKPKEIRRIITDEVLTKKIIDIFSYRESFCSEDDFITDNLDEFIIKNNNSLDLTRNLFVEKIISAKNKETENDFILDDFIGKKIKINLIDVEALKNDFRLLNEDSNQKTYYTNSKKLNPYFHSIQNVGSHNYCIVLSLKEGRQNNIFIVKYIFSTGKFESVIKYTPRLKKIADSILDTSEFKNYFFDNFIYFWLLL